MIEINSFGVLGGDQRQASMAESMAADGYPVLCAGLELSLIHIFPPRASPVWRKRWPPLRRKAGYNTPSSRNKRSQKRFLREC